MTLQVTNHNHFISNTELFHSHSWIQVGLSKSRLCYTRPLVLASNHRNPRVVCKLCSWPATQPSGCMIPNVDSFTFKHRNYRRIARSRHFHPNTWKINCSTSPMFALHLFASKHKEAGSYTTVKYQIWKKPKYWN